MRATPLVRRQGTNTLFKFKVNNWESERKASPRDSETKRCIICKIPNKVGITRCRFCNSQNWDQRFDSKLR